MGEMDFRCLLIGGTKIRGIANGMRNEHGTVFRDGLHNIIKPIAWNSSRSGSFTYIVDASFAELSFVISSSARECISA